MSKQYDCAVAVGEYTDAAGNRKKRYKTIGAVMQGEHGPYLLLDATCLSMQLFALANRDRRDSVLVSLYALKDTGPMDHNVNRDRAGLDAPSADDDVPF